MAMSEHENQKNVCGNHLEKVFLLKLAHSSSSKVKYPM